MPAGDRVWFFQLACTPCLRSRMMAIYARQATDMVLRRRSAIVSLEFSISGFQLQTWLQIISETGENGRKRDEQGNSKNVANS